MREIKTIDIYKYSEPDENNCVHVVGRISPREAFDTLKNHLDQNGLLPDEYFLEGDWEYSQNTELPNFSQALCHVNYGGSEGIYLDIALKYYDKTDNRTKFYDFATGKTLGESGDDFLKMSRIAAECNMMLNGFGQKIEFALEDPYIKQTNSIEREMNMTNQSSGLDILISDAQSKISNKPSTERFEKEQVER